MADNTFVNIGGHKVSAGIKYSTSEVKTGDVWIDGKPIYRRVFKDTTSRTKSANTSLNILEVTLDNSVIDNVVSLQGYYNNGSVRSIGDCQTAATGTPVYISSWGRYEPSTGKLVVILNGSSSADVTECVVILEYTKTTD